MVDLNPVEQLVIDTMKGLGATKDTNIKTADAIAAKCNRPKGMINNTLVALANKNLIKRVAREKASGYYIVSGEV
jgi:predicted transcriptional regulator